MAYDEHLAARLRHVLADEPGLTSKAMFGGLGFMLDGHMAVAAGSSGDLMVRVDPALGARLIADGAARPQVMRGRELAGWLTVDADALESDERLREAVGWGVDYVRTLPPK